jgi:hypothetical protein
MASSLRADAETQHSQQNTTELIRRLPESGDDPSQYSEPNTDRRSQRHTGQVRGPTSAPNADDEARQAKGHLHQPKAYGHDHEIRYRRRRRRL